MYKLGLTGGIGCGKSAVSKYLNNYTGIPVVDADLLAREVVKPGTDGLIQLAKAFGNEILTPEGYLNRPKLGSIVFNDPSKRARLDSIMFPLIHNESRRLFNHFETSNYNYIIYDAPLLIETGSHKSMDFVIVVTCPAETQVARIMQRNGLSETDARARVNAQWTNEMRIAEADYVIDNTGTLEDLNKRVEKIWDDIRNTTGDSRRYC